MSSGDFNKRVVLPASTVCIFLPLSLFDFVLSFKVYCHVLFVFPISRKELIAQYSRLSEEAARRERRALWRVQRMRLDDARTQFFMDDRQKIQVGDEYTHNKRKTDCSNVCP